MGNRGQVCELVGLNIPLGAEYTKKKPREGHVPAKTYVPPLPPPPFFGHNAFFRGGGVAFFEPPCGRNFVPPPLFYRKVFLGVGGINSAPYLL